MRFSVCLCLPLGVVFLVGCGHAQSDAEDRAADDASQTTVPVAVSSPDADADDSTTAALDVGDAAPIGDEMPANDASLPDAQEPDAPHQCPTSDGVEILSCPPDLTLERTDSVVLPPGASVLARPIILRFASGTTTVRFAVQSTFESSAVAVLRIGENGAPLELPTPVVEGNKLTFTAEVAGTYAVVERARVPAGCSTKEVAGNINAQNNAQLAELEGVTRLDGSLTIGGTVSDLSSLRCLTVAGSLAVERADSLSALKLASLADVRGSVFIVDNQSLTSVELPALKSVSGVAAFQFNPTLRTIDLHAITKLGGNPATTSLAFWSLPALLSADLSTLQAVPGTLFATLLGTSDMDALKLRLGALETVGGDVSIGTNNTLRDLAGLSSLKKIGGKLAVSDNPALTAAELSSLREVGSAIALQRNPKLAAVAFSALIAVGKDENDYSFTLTDSPALTKLSLSTLADTPGALVLRSSGTAGAPLTLDMASLARIGSSVLLYDVRSTFNLDGLAKLTNIAGGLNIASCNGLTDTNGLGSLRTVGYGVGIEACAKLTSVDLHSLSSVGGVRTGGLTLAGLPALTSADLRLLSTTTGQLSLASLGTPGGSPLQLDLSSVSSVAGPLTIESNTLTTLSAFKVLTNIGGVLTISKNNTLNSVAALETVTSLAGTLTVTSNPQLSTCAAKRLRDRIKPAGNISTIIGNLDDGC